MKLKITIPQEFKHHYNMDKFKDTLMRLVIDSHSWAGAYEKAFAKMLITAFEKSEIMPSDDTEPTESQVAEYCRKRCLVVLSSDLFHRLKSDQPTLRERALMLLLKWAVECDFGYDNFPEEYERYKDEIEDMNYLDGMIYIAEKEVERMDDLITRTL